MNIRTIEQDDAGCTWRLRWLMRLYKSSTHFQQASFIFEIECKALHHGISNRRTNDTVRPSFARSPLLLMLFQLWHNQPARKKSRSVNIEPQTHDCTHTHFFILFLHLQLHLVHLGRQLFTVGCIFFLAGVTLHLNNLYYYTLPTSTTHEGDNEAIRATPSQS